MRASAFDFSMSCSVFELSIAGFWASAGAPAMSTAPLAVALTASPFPFCTSPGSSASLRADVLRFETMSPNLSGCVAASWNPMMCIAESGLVSIHFFIICAPCTPCWFPAFS
jgi:hypothetical protein